MTRSVYKVMAISATAPAKACQLAPIEQTIGREWRENQALKLMPPKAANAYSERR